MRGQNFCHNPDMCAVKDGKKKLCKSDDSPITILSSCRKLYHHRKIVAQIKQIEISSPKKKGESMDIIVEPHLLYE